MEFRYRKTCKCQAVSLTEKTKSLLHQMELGTELSFPIDDRPCCSKCKRLWERVEVKLHE